MDAPDFDTIVNETCDSIKKVLSSKAKEYAKDDRLYNFKRAAKISQTTPELALAGMLVKHWVSVLDLIEGTLENTAAMVNEKIGDTINYLILLKAILQEKRNQLISPLMSAGCLGKGYVEINPDTPSVSGHGAVFAEMAKAATEEVAKTSKYPDKSPSVVTGPEGEYRRFGLKGAVKKDSAALAKKIDENEYDKFIKEQQAKPIGDKRFNVVARSGLLNDHRLIGGESLLYADAFHLVQKLNNISSHEFELEPCSNQQ